MTRAYDPLPLATPIRRLKVLVTGFDDFDANLDGQLDANVTKKLPQLLVSKLGTMTVQNKKGDAITAAISGHVLDVIWSRNVGDTTSPAGAGDVLEEVVKAQRPDVVIATGMRGPQFSIEGTALDVDGPYPDKLGQKFPDRQQYGKSKSDESYAIQTTLDCWNVEQAWEKAGVRWYRSFNAGTYICGDVFYRIMWMTKNTPHGKSILRGGFIHCPPDATDDELVAALEIVLRITLSSIEASEVT